jgi:hypothetical protein
MSKKAKLTLEILKPMVATGLKPKQIAHQTGVALRMVQRQLKKLGLQKSRIPNLPARMPELTQFHKSGGPILSKQFELDTAQFSAATALYVACTEDISVKGVDLAMMATREPTAIGLTDDERLSAAQADMKKWIRVCKSHIDPSTGEGIDHRPAMLIAGQGVAVKAAGRMLGISERRASKICKTTLDIYAQMKG